MAARLRHVTVLGGLIIGLLVQACDSSGEPETSAIETTQVTVVRDCVTNVKGQEIELAALEERLPNLMTQNQLVTFHSLDPDIRSGCMVDVINAIWASGAQAVIVSTAAK